MVKKKLTWNECQKLYPPGTRIRLIHMYDDYPEPDGMTGTIKYYENEFQGTISVWWDNGSHLRMLYDVDEWEKISD